jgi:hypothetical protein
VDLSTALWLVSAVGELCVFALLIHRRIWKTLPVFFLYMVWALVSDIALYLLYKYLPSANLQTYTLESSIDSLIQFAVLVELGWSVLKPIRNSLPKSTLAILSLLIAGAGLLIWPVAGMYMPADAIKEHARFLVHLEQTVAILRVVCFLVMASFSQLLSIGWRDRELQIATGLGFYSIVSLIIVVLHTHPMTRSQYESLYLVVTASYICSLTYWVLSFATKEQERREFSPQMQQFLLLMSGGARSGRIAVSALSADRQNQKDK